MKGSISVTTGLEMHTAIRSKGTRKGGPGQKAAAGGVAWIGPSQTANTYLHEKMGEHMLPLSPLCFVYSPSF